MSSICTTLYNKLHKQHLLDDRKLHFVCRYIKSKLEKKFRLYLLYSRQFLHELYCPLNMRFIHKFPLFYLSAAPDCFTCAFKAIFNGSILFTASCFHDGRGMKPKLEVGKLNYFIFVVINLPVLIAW